MTRLGRWDARVYACNQALLYTPNDFTIALSLVLSSSGFSSDPATQPCLSAAVQGTTGDLIVQLNAEHTLSKSGNCWVLD